MTARIRYARSGEGPPDALFEAADGTQVPGWLPRPSGEPPRRYLLAGVIAGWFGVGEATVKKWHSRHPDCPRAVAELEARGNPAVAWDAGSEEAFRGFRETLPGQGAKGTRKGGFRDLTEAERAGLAEAWEAVPVRRSGGRDLRSPAGARARAILAACYGERVRVGDLSAVTGLSTGRITQIVRLEGQQANRGAR